MRLTPDCRHPLTLPSKIDPATAARIGPRLRRDQRASSFDSFSHGDRVGHPRAGLHGPDAGGTSAGSARGGRVASPPAWIRQRRPRTVTGRRQPGRSRLLAGGIPPVLAVELDYGGLVHLIGDDALCGDQSVAELRAAVHGRPGASASSPSPCICAPVAAGARSPDSSRRTEYRGVRPGVRSPRDQHNSRGPPAIRPASTCRTVISGYGSM